MDVLFVLFKVVDIGSGFALVFVLRGRRSDDEVVSFFEVTAGCIDEFLEEVEK